VKTKIAFAASSSLFFAALAASAALAGCAHPQSVTLTSAAAVAPPAPPPAAPVPPAEVAEEAAEPEAAPAEEAKVEAKKADGPMSFAQLSAALGDDKLALDVNQSQKPTPAPAVKGLSAEGYSAVGAVHQALDTGAGSHAGDMKVSGGMTQGAVRSGVHEAAARLRACYEHGLAANPRLAGRVTVSFSVDARGAVAEVDTESDVIPADVLSCVKDAFSAMTFAPPKSAPAKIVYPVDFNKDS
jgi:hypothetical protein